MSSCSVSTTLMTITWCSTSDRRSISCIPIVSRPWASLPSQPRKQVMPTLPLVPPPRLPPPRPQPHRCSRWRPWVPGNALNGFSGKSSTRNIVKRRRRRTGLKYPSVPSFIESRQFRGPSSPVGKTYEFGQLVPSDFLIASFTVCTCECKFNAG